MQDRGKDGRGTVPAEWQPARRHLVEHRTEAENIRACIEFLAAGLFRRHVGRCADGHAGAGELIEFHDGRLRLAGWPLFRVFHMRGDGELRQAEIQNLRLAASGDNNVRRLDVTVNDPLLVSRIERIGNLYGKIQQVLDAQRLGANPVLERLAFQILHGDERLAAGFINLVNGANIRMAEG